MRQRWATLTCLVVSLFSPVHSQPQPADCDNIPKEVCQYEKHVKTRCPLLCGSAHYISAPGRRGIHTIVYYRSAPLTTVAGAADVAVVLQQWLKNATVETPASPEAAKQTIEGLHNARNAEDNMLRLIVLDGTVISMRTFATHLPQYSTRRRLGIYSVMFFENPLYTYTTDYPAAGEEGHAATNVQMRFMAGPGRNTPDAKFKEGGSFALMGGKLQLLDGDWLHQWHLLEPAFDFLSVREGWPELVRRLALLGVNGAGPGIVLDLQPPSRSKYNYNTTPGKHSADFDRFVQPHANLNTVLNEVERGYARTVASQRADYGVLAKIKMTMTCQARGAYYLPAPDVTEGRPYATPQCNHGLQNVTTPNFRTRHCKLLRAS